MKIRSSFISNSSSSSFIVRTREITIEEAGLLEEYGFSLTDCHFASQQYIKGPGEGDPVSYGLTVLCNEGDVVGFLTKHNIPFQAFCHYGHYSAFFKRGDESVLIANNKGLEVETYDKSLLGLSEEDRRSYSWHNIEDYWEDADDPPTLLPETDY